jgi:hypothetical protein
VSGDTGGGEFLLQVNKNVSAWHPGPLMFLQNSQPDMLGKAFILEGRSFEKGIPSVTLQGSWKGGGEGVMAAPKRNVGGCH